MLNSFVRRILKLSPLLRDLAVSAAGCFALMRGFRLVAIEKEGSDTAASGQTAGTRGKQLAEIGAALFLLAFIAIEALTTIGALRR
ncbi:MAG: hypothetical protein ABSB50_10055 [Terracidiphilus sp.]|jgi:hypothetical protein